MIETIVDKELNKRHGSIAVKRVEQAEGFDIYAFYTSNQEEVELGDEFDFQQFFSEIAESVYNSQKEDFSSFLIATDMGARRLYVIDYSDEDCLKYKWSTVFLRQFQMTLSPDQLSGSLGFFAEVGLVDASDLKFKKEAGKVARMLQDENKDAWIEIIDNQTNFVKTDVYVFRLNKLYAWGFQPILPDGELNSNLFLVRPKPLIARGAVRKERKNKSGKRVRFRLVNARSRAGGI